MTMRQTKWFGAALAGALAMAPAARADDSAQSNDRAGNSPQSTEKSRSSMENAPPSYQVGTPADPAVKRDRESEGRDLSGTGSANTGSSDTGSRARSSGTMRDSGSPVAGTTGSSSSSDLLQRLHAGNQAEIEAGQWMQQHAQNDKVKDFAKKMVKDHQDMDKDVQKFAQKQGVSLTAGASSDPTAAKDRHDMHAMEGMPAQQADRHYMTMMVNDHQRDVSEVRSAADQAKSSNDKDLAKLLDKTAKKMEDHLKDAEKIQRDLGSRQARNPSSR
jgi:putative membrane protein